ncbi:hypothetical protein KHQ84_gp219 [Rhodococcus phage Finch]|uniref:Uncharacterized protein n=1 Tax=Rhodococcus phage Finch TaxID=2094144 RepID=A0A2P1JXU3_9CAUD|nr:hypothetical protein KHQ84_gp219 [Rhodococcus phage Finch]AVO25138.1 hypothetical protein SEA_FINCH_219 [Rhodococcus phage Finch]
MSHFSVMLFIDVAKGQRMTDELLSAKINTALAPYDENMEVPEYIDEVVTLDRVAEIREQFPEDYEGMDDLAVMNEYHGRDNCRVDDTGNIVVLTTYNPDSKWDWWQIGGRFGGLLSKSGVEVSQGWIKDLDMETARKQARQSAEQEYDAFEEAVKGLEVPDDWDTVRERWGKDNIDQARAEYQNTEFNLAVGEKLKRYFWLSNPHEVFFVNKGGREAYVADAVGRVGCSYAVITTEGEYKARGDMGWFGMSSNESDTWREDYWTYFNSLDPESTYWVLLDMHI